MSGGHFRLLVAMLSATSPPEQLEALALDLLREAAIQRVEAERQAEREIAFPSWISQEEVSDQD